MVTFEQLLRAKDAGDTALAVSLAIQFMNENEGVVSKPYARAVEVVAMSYMCSARERGGVDSDAGLLLGQSLQLWQRAYTLHRRREGDDVVTTNQAGCLIQQANVLYMLGIPFAGEAVLAEFVRRPMSEQDSTVIARMVANFRRHLTTA